MCFPVYYNTESAWRVPPHLQNTIYSLHHPEHPLTTYLHRRWQEQKTQNRCHSKKPQVKVNAQSERNTITINNDTNMDGQDLTPKSKKSKPTLTQAAVPVPQNKPSIIEIDDNNNLKNEQLMKSSPTADIKEFFIPLPHKLGQEKGHM